MRVHTTTADERLDLIVFDEYGAVSGYLEAVLDYEDNRGLGELGPVLPAGVEVTLPDLELPTASTTETVRLWD